LKTFKQLMTEMYVPKNELSKIQKIIKPFISGRVKSERGAHEYPFEEKNYEKICKALKKVYGNPIYKEHGTSYYDGKITIHVQAPDPKWPNVNMYVIIKYAS